METDFCNFTNIDLQNPGWQNALPAWLQGVVYEIGPLSVRYIFQSAFLCAENIHPLHKLLKVC